MLRKIIRELQTFWDSTHGTYKACHISSLIPFHSSYSFQDVPGLYNKRIYIKKANVFFLLNMCSHIQIEFRIIMLENNHNENRLMFFSFPNVYSLCDVSNLIYWLNNNRDTITEKINSQVNYYCCNRNIIFN